MATKRKESSDKAAVPAKRKRTSRRSTTSNADIDGEPGDKSTELTAPSGTDSRLMNLPQEIRDHIYTFIARETTATIVRQAPGEIISSHPLCHTSKQIRSEFKAILYLEAGHLVAKVQNFDFRHIVTFFNRLSEREHKTLLALTPSEDQKPYKIRKRVLEIELGIKRAEEVWNIYAGNDEYLRRWIKRAGHPTKQGANVECVYTCLPKKVVGFHSMHVWIQSARKLYEQLRDGPGKEELVKVINALDKANNEFYR
jgi:hypothetical protein